MSDEILTRTGQAIADAIAKVVYTQVPGPTVGEFLDALFKNGVQVTDRLIRIDFGSTAVSRPLVITRTQAGAVCITEGR